MDQSLRVERDGGGGSGGCLLIGQLLLCLALERSGGFGMLLGFFYGWKLQRPQHGAAKGANAGKTPSTASGVGLIPVKSLGLSCIGWIFARIESQWAAFASRSMLICFRR